MIEAVKAALKEIRCIPLEQNKHKYALEPFQK